MSHKVCQNKQIRKGKDKQKGKRGGGNRLGGKGKKKPEDEKRKRVRKGSEEEGRRGRTFCYAPFERCFLLEEEILI
jgi:hypothetical protein